MFWRPHATEPRYGPTSRQRRDPEKLKEGLAQLSNNPMLKGLADAVPGLREVLDDPEALEEQVTSFLRFEPAAPPTVFGRALLFC